MSFGAKIRLEDKANAHGIPTLRCCIDRGTEGILKWNEQDNYKKKCIPYILSLILRFCYFTHVRV